MKLYKVQRTPQKTYRASCTFKILLHAKSEKQCIHTYTHQFFTVLTLTSKQITGTCYTKKHIIKSEKYCETKTLSGNRWDFKHCLKDDTKFEVQIEMVKLFHRAGAAIEKLLSYLQQIGMPLCRILVQRDMCCLVQSKGQCIFGDNVWNRKP